MTESKNRKPGRDIFNSTHYEGFVPEKRAILLFASESDCNVFLNWWCLGGELPKPRGEVMRGTGDGRTEYACANHPNLKHSKTIAKSFDFECKLCGSKLELAKPDEVIEFRSAALVNDPPSQHTKLKDTPKPKPQCPKCYADNIGIRCRACGWVGDKKELLIDKFKCKCCGQEVKRSDGKMTIHGHICGYCLAECYAGATCTRLACGNSPAATERNQAKGTKELGK